MLSATTSNCFYKSFAEIGVSSSSLQAKSSAEAGIGILIITLAIIISSPGMLFLAVFKDVFLRSLDRGQMWVFSIHSSLALLFSLRLTLYSWDKALTS